MYFLAWYRHIKNSGIQMIFGSSLSPVVSWRAHVLFTLIVFAAYSGVQHILSCVFASSSSCVLCPHCCQCFWIIYFSFPLRYSLMFKLGVCAQISALSEMMHSASSWLKMITEKCVHFGSCSYHIVLLLLLYV